MRLILFLASIYSFLIADNAVQPNMIPDSIVYSIQKNECYVKDGECYPYIIAFNTKKDISKAKKHGFKIFKRRLLDCGNSFSCSSTLKKLHDINIVNTDNGPFQANHKYNPVKNLRDYFVFTKAEKHTRTILARLINRYGYSWETIGRYHSGTSHLNKTYYRKIYKHLYNKTAPVGF